MIRYTVHRYYCWKMRLFFPPLQALISARCLTCLHYNTRLPDCLSRNPLSCLFCSLVGRVILVLHVLISQLWTLAQEVDSAYITEPICSLCAYNKDGSAFSTASSIISEVRLYGRRFTATYPMQMYKSAIRVCQAAPAGFLSPRFYVHFGLMQQKRVSETPESVFHHAKISQNRKWKNIGWVSCEIANTWLMWRLFEQIGSVKHGQWLLNWKHSYNLSNWLQLQPTPLSVLNLPHCCCGDH